MKKQKSISIQIAIDMLLEQLKWSIWFITIMVLLHVVGSLFSIRVDFKMNNLYGFSYYSTQIFMLVIAIIAGANFLPFYVKHGVTRKNYYIGTVLGAFGLSVSLPVIFGVLTIIEKAIFGLFDIHLTIEPIIANSYNWFITLIIYSINIFIYYLIGWFINVGYYKFGWLIGMGFILLSIGAATLHGVLWENQVLVLFGTKLTKQVSDNTILFSLIGTIALIGIMLGMIRLITKKVAIKI